MTPKLHLFKVHAGKHAGYHPSLKAAQKSAFLLLRNSPDTMQLTISLCYCNRMTKQLLIDLLLVGELAEWCVREEEIQIVRKVINKRGIMKFKKEFLKPESVAA